MKQQRKKPRRPPPAAPAAAVSVGDDSAAGEEDPGAALDIDFGPSPGQRPAAPGGARTRAANRPPPAIKKS